MTGEEIITAILQLTRTLEAAGHDYVIGGAVALAYYIDPRSTRDIDITIDIDMFSLPQLIEELRAAGATVDAERVLSSAARGDFGFYQSGIRVDAFLPQSELIESALQRRVRVPFGSSHVFVMSREDVLLTKLIFGRDKDFVDLIRLLAERDAPLDTAYCERWITELFEPDDPRVLKLREIQRNYLALR